jgi:hypothetical protein
MEPKIKATTIINLISQIGATEQAGGFGGTIAEEKYPADAKKLPEVTYKSRPKLTKDLVTLAAFDLAKTGAKRIGREELEVQSFKVYYAMNRAQRRSKVKGLRSLYRKAMRRNMGNKVFLSQKVEDSNE